MKAGSILILLVVFVCSWAENFNNKKRSFAIDPHSNAFIKDGSPFRYISGTIHYFRVRPEYWRDRLRKLRYAGCNVVQTYIEWSSHEPEPEKYNFAYDVDILNFIKIAQEEDLLVILRPGPYIDAERDFGGFPYWLLREDPKMSLRKNDPSYLFYVDRWFNKLFPMLKGYLYENGGPIIMVQIENEYGADYACDFEYTTHLKELTRSLLGGNVVLFTTDNAATGILKCGKIAGVYATVDFGITNDVAGRFRAQRLFEPEGPLINSEFYPGWIDHWGDPHSTRASEDVAATLDAMLAMNASVNIYVFNGGTSFGMKSGSNYGNKFQACPTSYDFDAPLNEAGDATEKYYVIRNVTQKYVPLPAGPVPPPSNKYAYGNVKMTLTAGALQVMEVLNSTVSPWPLTYEALSVPNGMVAYTSKIPANVSDPAKLTLNDIHDRGYVFIDKEYVGIVSRETGSYELPIFAKANQMLTIVVESQGRVCFGDLLKDFKGLTTNVTLGPLKLKNWVMTPFPSEASELSVAFNLVRQKTLGRVTASPLGGMAFYEGSFNVPTSTSHPQDTFLRLNGWGKGYAWINNFLLGRYWPVVGPQVTLYIPSSLLKRGKNSLILLELEEAPCGSASTCKATLVDVPEINGPTPQW